MENAKALWQGGVQMFFRLCFVGDGGSITIGTLQKIVGGMAIAVR